VALRNHAAGAERRQQVVQRGVDLVLASKHRIRAATVRQVNGKKPPYANTYTLRPRSCVPVSLFTTLASIKFLL
jgi:hypothetical protein